MKRNIPMYPPDSTLARTHSLSDRICASVASCCAACSPIFLSRYWTATCRRRDGESSQQPDELDFGNLLQLPLLVFVGAALTPSSHLTLFLLHFFLVGEWVSFFSHPPLTGDLSGLTGCVLSIAIESLRHETVTFGCSMLPLQPLLPSFGLSLNDEWRRRGWRGEASRLPVPVPVPLLVPPPNRALRLPLPLSLLPLRPNRVLRLPLLDGDLGGPSDGRRRSSSLCNF